MVYDTLPKLKLTPDFTKYLFTSILINNNMFWTFLWYYYFVKRFYRYVPNANHVRARSTHTHTVLPHTNQYCFLLIASEGEEAGRRAL